MKDHRVAISQSNYIPWRGYFDMVASVDEFVIYDDAQFTRRDWRNRNLIKTPNGKQWLTIPVESKGNYNSKISEMKVADSDWRNKHWKSIEHSYLKAPYFHETREWLAKTYGDASFEHLSDINRHFMVAFMERLEIKTPILSSNGFQLRDGRNERLLHICLELGATHYVSGPAAQDYLDEALFASHGLVIEWFSYSGYSPYPQLWGEFCEGLSIVDLLFNCGPVSPAYLEKEGS